IMDDSKRSYTVDIEVAYKEWAEAKGESANVLLLQAFSENHIRKLYSQILELDIDSIYTVSEEIAVAILKWSQAHGTHVPGKLAIISAVNSTMLSVTTPSISAVELFPWKAGEAAVNLLISSMTGLEPLE